MSYKEECGIRCIRLVRYIQLLYFTKIIQFKQKVIGIFCRCGEVLSEAFISMGNPFVRLREIHHGPFGPVNRRKGGVFLGEKNQEMNELACARQEMQNLWQEMQRRGTKLYLDGRSVSPKEAARRTVREESPYMADYIIGEDGTVSQIRFNRVTDR